MRVLGSKIGEGVVQYWPLTNSFFFWGYLRLCQFWWKSIEKCDRERARRRTDWQTQTDYIIFPMLYAIAMGQIMKIVTRICGCGVSRWCPLWGVWTWWSGEAGNTVDFSANGRTWLVKNTSKNCLRLPVQSGQHTWSVSFCLLILLKNMLWYWVR